MKTTLQNVNATSTQIYADRGSSCLQLLYVEVGFMYVRQLVALSCAISLSALDGEELGFWTGGILSGESWRGADVSKVWTTKAIVGHSVRWREVWEWENREVVSWH